MFKRRNKELLKNKEELKYYSYDVPDNTFSRDENNKFYYISSRKRYVVSSERILNSWSPPSISLIFFSSLKKIPYAGKLGFRPGSLITDISDNKTYLISSNKRRLITNPDVFDFLGYGMYDSIMASHEETLLHPLGDELS